MKETISRRDFTKLMSIAASGFALSGCAVKKLITGAEVEWRPRVEQWIASACLQCAGGCGVSARVVDGFAVKLEGNPLHPINRGRLCPLGQASLQQIYSPDRIKAPMRQVGGKGSNKWIKISWDEATRIITERLKELRQQGEPHSVVIFDGGQRGLMRTLLERFCEAYGTPNHIVSSPPDGTRVAHNLSHGIDDLFAYDLENTNYILSFGCGLLDGWRNPVGAAHAYGFLRQERAGAKAKLVQIERRFSTTGAKADEWIPINPGTEGALALAIAYVIIREGLYDRNFVENYTFGFDDWSTAQGESHTGFKSLVLRDYRPDDVAEISGVPVDTIIRLAKEFAASKPAIAIADDNATHYSNGTYNALAIHALNALVGSIEVKGGVILAEPVPLTDFPPLQTDAVAEKGLSMPRIDVGQTARVLGIGHLLDSIPGNITNNNPYQVNAVFFCNSNPVFSARAQESFVQALKKVPLVVSFSSFIDETAEHADLILPDHLMLEKWIDAPVPPLFGVPVLTIAQPAIKPLYDTMHTGDVILKITNGMEGQIAGAFPWKDFKEVLTFAVEGLHQSERGAVFSEPSEEAYARELQERGWATNDASANEDFWQALVEKGGWSGIVREYGRWGKILKTPSNKFEFYSQRLREKLEVVGREKTMTLDGLLGELKIEARGDNAFLPHYEPIRWGVNESDYPLFLNPFSTLALNSESSANLPWVQEIAGPHVGVMWNSWAEINPATGLKLGIEDGDEIWIESTRGRVKTQAKLYPGTMPNVVNVPYGFGHRAFGRWAKDIGINPNSILEIAADSLSGLPARFSTRVKVHKA